MKVNLDKITAESRMTKEKRENIDPSSKVQDNTVSNHDYLGINSIISKFSVWEQEYEHNADKEFSWGNTKKTQTGTCIVTISLASWFFIDCCNVMIIYEWR